MISIKNNKVFVMHICTKFNCPTLTLNYFNSRVKKFALNILEFTTQSFKLIFINLNYYELQDLLFFFAIYRL